MLHGGEVSSWPKTDGGIAPLQAGACTVSDRCLVQSFTTVRHTVAGHLVAGLDFAQRRRRAAAVGAHVAAAVGKATARGGLDELGHGAGNGLQPRLVRRGQVDTLALQRFRRLLLRLQIDKPYAERPWPGPAPRPAETCDGPSVNAACPYSGKPVTHVLEMQGRRFGFCNAFCRDKTVADPEAWPAFMALYHS